MNKTVLIIPLLVSFFVTLFVIPLWMRKVTFGKIVGRDVHKAKYVEVPEMGGITIMAGFLVGILLFVGLNTYLFKTYLASLQVLAMLVSVLIAVVIGLVDDSLGWKIGLQNYQKPILTIAAATPIVVLNLGHSSMNLPLLGTVEFGLFYPFVIVPIAIVGASNGFNMIAGYNGLEAGMGSIMLLTLGLIAYKAGDIWTFFIAMAMLFSLLAFLTYNYYPAKIFPGDTMTYPVGALIAIIAIMGNLEKAGVILFIPYFLELILKARGRFKKESFARVMNDGSLCLRYEKIYGLEHLAIKIISPFRKVKETTVVWSLWGLEIILGSIAYLVYL